MSNSFIYFDNFWTGTFELTFFVGRAYIFLWIQYFISFNWSFLFFAEQVAPFFHSVILHISVISGQTFPSNPGLYLALHSNIYIYIYIYDLSHNKYKTLWCTIFEVTNSIHLVIRFPSWQSVTRSSNEYTSKYGVSSYTYFTEKTIIVCLTLAMTNSLSRISSKNQYF